jgi:hypothetical protein
MRSVERGNLAGTLRWKVVSEELQGEDGGTFHGHCMIGTWDLVYIASSAGICMLFCADPRHSLWSSERSATQPHRVTKQLLSPPYVEVRSM